MSDCGCDEKLDEHKKFIDECSADKDARISELNAKLDTVNAQLADIKDLLQAWNTAKGFVQVINAMSITVKAVAPVAAFVAAIWYLITHGKLP